MNIRGGEKKMEEIQLKDFIEHTLVNIAQGVKIANKTLKDNENAGNGVYSLRSNIGTGDKAISGIQFDVAVTATKNNKDKAGFVVALFNIGGGTNIERSTGNEMVHRIKFEIGISNIWE